jgi:hypothetical protein
MRKKTTRLMLEALEDRCVPSTTCVWGGASGDWSRDANWQGGAAPGLNDSASFPSTNGGAYTVNVDVASTCAGMQINDGNLTLKLSAPLTLKGSADATANGCGNFSMNTGVISPQANADGLTLDNIGGQYDHGGGSYWKGGTIGNATTLGATLLVKNNSLLYVAPSSSGSVSFTGIVQVAGQTASDTSTVNVSGTMNTNAGCKITVGSAADGNGVFSMQGGTVTAAGTPSGEVDVYGTFNANNGGSTTVTSTINMPLKVLSGGVANVQSHNELDLTGDTAFDNTVDVAGTFNIGAQNATDTGPGNSIVRAATGGAAKGGTWIESGAVLACNGINLWYDGTGLGATDFNVDGRVNLTGSNIGTSWLESDLTVGTGSVHFNSGSTLYMEGRADTGHTSDSDLFSATLGTITINSSATLIPTKAVGTLAASWQFMAGNVISGKFANPAGWTVSQPYTIPGTSIMGEKVTTN